MILRYIKALLEIARHHAETPPKPLPDPMALAYASAVLDIGEREDPWGSNSGAYVEGLRVESRLPRLAGGEWCAVFCSVHMLRARLDIRSRSARKLVRKLAKQGRRVGLADLHPGLCGLSLHRRSGGWHVRLWRCEEVAGVPVICSVGGNERHQVMQHMGSVTAYVATAKMMATVEETK
jgi:hypothetical protein